MAILKIRLTDEQWYKLLQAIDLNSDGVLTREEWRQILAPKIATQTDYVKLMGNVNIPDPLSLEERVLDLQFRNRRLENEVRDLRHQAATKKQAQKDMKKMAERILQLEEADEKKLRERKAKETELDAKMRRELLARAQVKHDLERLEKETQQLERQQREQADEDHQELTGYERRHQKAVRQIVDAKQARDELESRYRLVKARETRTLEQESKLDAEIDELLGKARRENGGKFDL